MWEVVKQRPSKTGMCGAEPSRLAPLGLLVGPPLLTWDSILGCSRVPRGRAACRGESRSLLAFWWGEK